MQNVSFSIDFGAGFVSVGPPKNWKAMKVQLIFTNLQLQAQLQSIAFEWVGKNAVLLNQYIKNGLTGGMGILEAPGLRVVVGSMQIFDGCIDMAHEDAEIQSDFIKCPIVESGKIDWLNNVAPCATFRYLTTDDYLHSLNFNPAARITRSDYKQVPYCLTGIPNYDQIVTLGITEFLIVKEIASTIMTLNSLIARAIATAPTVILLIETIIEIAIYIAYLIVLIIAGIKMMQKLFDNIIQKKKTKLAMRELDLFLKMCAFFDLGFQSSIYGYGVADGYNGKYVNATWMPEKITQPDGDPLQDIFHRPADETTSVNAYGYFEGTFQDFINQMNKTYSAKCTIKNNILIFEEWHKPDILNPFTLPNEGEPGNTFLYPQPYCTNASENPLVYILRAQKDDQETNTYRDYDGTYCIAQTRPTLIHNQKNLMIKGGVTVDLGFALARRKIGLTIVEATLQDIFDKFTNFVSTCVSLVNNVTSTLNSAISLAGVSIPAIPVPAPINLINDRIGWMLLSNDFIGVPKRFIGIQNGDDWYVDVHNSSNSLQYSSVASDPTLNGTFDGFCTGIPELTAPITGSVIAGVMNLSIPVGGPGTGARTGIITGTIAGHTGTYTGVLHGSITLGLFHGNVHINSTTITSILTDNYGSTKSLMDDFHKYNLFDYNQYLLFKNKRFKFSVKDWNAITNNNVFITADGRYGLFDKIVWDIHNDEAIEVDYRIKERYTNNFITTISTDGG